MKIYRSKGEPKKYKITGIPLEDESWELAGELPSRISILRNPTNVDLTEKEIREHLYLTEELLKRVIKDIEKAELKI